MQLFDTYLIKKKKMKIKFQYFRTLLFYRSFQIYVFITNLYRHNMYSGNVACRIKLKHIFRIMCNEITPFLLDKQ